MSRRTFFRYFPSKEAAFFVEQRERMEAFDRALDALLPGRTAWQAVRAALLGTAGSFVADRPHALAWRAGMRASPTLVAADLAMDAEWEALIRARFVAEGWAPLRAAVGAGAVMGVARAVLVAWYESDGRADLVELGRTGLDALEQGFEQSRVSPRTGA